MEPVKFGNSRTHTRNFTSTVMRPLEKTFSKMTLSEESDFPVNSKFEKLIPEKSEIHFTNNYPFSFQNMNPEAHTLLLEPGEFPLPEKNNSNELNVFTTQYEKGAQQKYDDKEGFENQLKKISKLGNINIPSVFLQNSSDYIPEKFAKGEIISTLSGLDRCKAPEKVIMINLDSMKLTSIPPKKLFKRFLKFPNLEIISLNSTGLTGLSDDTFPNLRIFTVCDNNLDNSAQVISFAQRHQKLSVFDFRRNQVSQNDSIRLEITATSINLKFLNSREITLRDRVTAMEHFHQKFRPKDIARLHFLLQIKSIPEISALSTWNPAMLRHLSLPSCGLSYVCLHKFTMLQSLNLSDNAIEKLDESGIVYCQYLISLDLSDNRISEMSQVEVIKFLRSLRHVWLNGNMVGHYRSYLIYKCRRSCGTSAMNGLQSVDGIPVTSQELIASMVNVHPEVHRQKVPRYMYQHDVERRIGNTTIEKDPKAFRKMTSLSLVDRQLSVVDVRHFKNITHLCLRGNTFEKVDGLGECKNLVLLDVSHNPNLKIESFAEDIRKLMKLQFIMAATDCWDPKYQSIVTYDDLFADNAPTHSVRNRNHRRQIIDLFVYFLPALSSVDRARISVQERIQVLESKGVNKDLLDEYRCNVAIAQASKPAAWLDLRPTEVAQGKQYDPGKIWKLHRLTNCGLSTHPMLEFSRFIILENIDLSRNKLTKITPLNLTKLPLLKYVDLSFNEINETAEEVGNVIDNIKSLRMISLRGNPVVNTQDKRTNLLKTIKRLANQYDSLRVIDCEISPVDIYETRTWENVRGAQKPRLLFLLSLKIRLPFEAKQNLVTQLDLSNCGLSYCDVTRFSNLRRLVLSNNEFKNNEQVVGLQEIGTVEFLDMRNNHIERLESFLFFITLCPKLKNIGIEGNPCAQKDYRKSIISHIPSIAKADYPLIAIDDCPILAEEIKSAVKDGSIREFDKFSFELAVSRNKDTENVLDLSSSSLKSYLDLSSFSTIKLLNIRANKLTGEAIMKSKLNECDQIEYLDASQNNISDKSIGQYLGELDNLQRLEISKNPICQRKEDWKTFLINYTKISDVNCKLNIINGHKLTLDERCSIVKHQTESEEASEEFRTNYILTMENPDWALSKSIYLSKQGITSITILKLAKSLQFLDISNNNIKTLKGQGFENFVNLTTLDIHENQIQTIEEIREELSNCPRLERLYMINSTEEKDLTNDPASYVGYMTNILRGLTDIDRYGNAFPLKANQLNAIKDIEQITGWNNPNHIHDIDLSDRNISLKDFPQVLTSLAALGPRSISFKGNPCTSIDKYRFLVIYNVPDVQFIDGSQVTIDQRMNADKSVRANVGTSKAENIIIAGALVGAEYVDKEKRESTLSTVKTVGKYAVEYAVKFGSWMMKLEIFITFQQILTLILSLIDKIKWPKIYIDFSWLAFIFAIDFSFLKYLLDIKLPFWYQYCSFFIYILMPAVLFCIYHFQPNREYWNMMLTVGYKQSILRLIYFFFILVVMNTGLSFLADLNYTIEYRKLTNNQWAWFTVLNVIALIICIAIFFCIRWYNKNSDSPVVWFKAMKLKKRFALFLLTVMYFPICKAFVDTFTCSDGVNKAFSELECFDSFSKITIVQVAAFLFGLVYAIGIPYFFIKLINKGVREIDLNYRIDVQIKQLEERKKEVKKMKKAGENVEDEERQIKKTEKKIKKSYAAAAIEYENAASYLYNAYERKDRYKKVISMIEKLAYLLFSSFVPTKWVESALSTVLMFGTTLLELITNPFNATNENVLEGASKIGNFLTLLIGDGCQFGWFGGSESNSVVIGVILIVIVLILLTLCIYFMIAGHCCCCCKREDREFASEYSSTQEEEEEEEEEEEGKAPKDGDNDRSEEEEEESENMFLKSMRTLGVGSSNKNKEINKDSSKYFDEAEVENIRGLAPLKVSDSDDDSTSGSGIPLEDVSDSKPQNVENAKPRQTVEILDSI